MKEFRCKECNCFLGEMEKGKVHKNIITLCTECYDVYKTQKDLNNYKNNVSTDSMPDFMKEFFDKGKQGKYE